MKEKVFENHTTIKDNLKKYISKLFYLDGDEKKIYPLYTLRFLFFIFIFVHHCYSYVKIPILKQPALSVSGFIILSGFLNGYIYIKKDFKLKEVFKFTINRIKKLYPLHIVMVCVALSYSGVFNITKLSQLTIFLRKILSNVFLLQSWINDKSFYFSFNGVTWYLSTYMFLCAMTIPILIVLKKLYNKKHKNFYFITLSVILFVATLIIVYIINLNKLDDKFCAFWIYVFPPSRLFEYIIGIIFGIICSNKKINFKFDKIIFSILEIASLVPLFIFINDISKIQFVNTFLNYRLNKWIIPVIIMLCVFSHQKGIISKIFSMKILVYLGEISMYMFMVHLPLKTLIIKATGKAVHYRYVGLYMLILTIIISIFIDKYKKNKEQKVVKQ